MMKRHVAPAQESMEIHQGSRPGDQFVRVTRHRTRKRFDSGSALPRTGLAFLSTCVKRLLRG